jgi:hypothetical protein
MDWVPQYAVVLGGGYSFELTATDDHGGVSAPKTILVKVDNAPTVISIYDPDPADPASTTGLWRELETFRLGVQDTGNPFFDPEVGGKNAEHPIWANDQEIERTGLNAYYELFINGKSLTTYNTDAATGGWAQVLNFDDRTGYFDWTPNNLDTGGAFTFTLIHYDGNGSSDTGSFTLQVVNTIPTLTVPNTAVDFYEDAGTAQDPTAPVGHYTILDGQIDSDQEGLDLHYTLTVTRPDGTSFTLDRDVSPIAPLYVNNGGGALIFNDETGEIVWKTNNADVTVDRDNANANLEDPNDPSNAYTFTVQAVDNRGGKSDSDPSTPEPEPLSFPVRVYNTTTDLGPIADRTFTEDHGLTVPDGDVKARDEAVGPASYTLYVQREGSAEMELGAYNDLVQKTGGTPIQFNPITGKIDWAATNADVGNYTFRVVHDDHHGSDAEQSFNVKVVNDPPVFTSSPPNGTVVPATHHFVYDPATTDEGQHDWRANAAGERDDNVTYSLVQAPNGMTIDPVTGRIDWVADPAFGGSVTIVIKVSDGNGGEAFQTVTFTVDVPTNEIPIEHRPGFDVYGRLWEVGDRPWESGRPWETGGRDMFGSYGEGNAPGLEGLIPPERLLGSPNEGWTPLGADLDEMLRKGRTGLQDLIAALEAPGLRQPEPEIGGSEPPVTPLAGYAPEVEHGRRLHFNAEELQLWQSLGLEQPNLGIGGTETPDTPLEGYAEAVEQGKRLNFSYFPIKESLEFKLDDLRIGDILGL